MLHMLRNAIAITLALPQFADLSTGAFAASFAPENRADQCPNER